MHSMHEGAYHALSTNSIDDHRIIITLSTVPPLKRPNRPAHPNPPPLPVVLAGRETPLLQAREFPEMCVSFGNRVLPYVESISPIDGFLP